MAFSRRTTGCTVEILETIDQSALCHAEFVIAVNVFRSETSIIKTEEGFSTNGIIEVLIANLTPANLR